MTFDKRHINKIGHMIDFTKKYQEEFYEKNKFYGFKHITEERKNEIIEKASLWSLGRDNLRGSERLGQIFITIGKSNRILKLEHDDEMYLFMIFAFDPELKALQIFYDEAKKEQIKERFEEEFHMKYDNRILEIEKHYNKRFPTIIDEFEQKR